MWKKLMKELNLTDSYISMGLGLLVVLIVGVLLFNYFSGRPQPSINDNGEQTTEEGSEITSDELPTTHTIADGETLWSISEKYYKSGYNWVDIAKENNISDPSLIEVGQKLIIPRAEPIIASDTADSAESAPSAPSVNNYTVKAGDTLWAIAESVYKDGYRWSDIAQANNLADPNTIHSGNILVMPK